MATINGTANPEQLWGTDDSDTMNGFGGDDILTGMGGDDILHGGDGNDVLQGHSGAGLDSDTLYGEAGDDTLIVGDGGHDVAHGGDGDDILVIHGGGERIDYFTVTANSAGGYDGSYGGPTRTVTFTSIEHFSITTGDGNDHLTVPGGDHWVNLRQGDDFLDAGTGIANANGWTGEDGISVDLSTAAQSIYCDVWGQGYWGPGSYSGFEYFGTLRTGSGNDEISTGFIDRDETLFLGAGDDILYVRHGNDVAHGGSGNDLLVVDYRNAIGAITVSVTPAAGGAGGFDGSYTEAGGRSVAFTSFERFELRTGAGQENLSFGGADDKVWSGGGDDIVHSGGGHDLIFGEDGNDHLYGEDGDDQLDGGAGNDEMHGGEGSDIYFATAGDVVVETGTTGTDEVRTDAASFSIEAVAGIENLTGTGAVDQTLTGNAGANRIDGGGGVDVLIGGAGNDTYIVSDVGDSVVELAGGGIDEVQASFSYALDAEVENLTLTGFFDHDGYGNALANVITGNIGNNLLSGGDGDDNLDAGDGWDVLIGGAGADRLTGGAGLDIFFYAATGDSVAGAADTIVGFDTGLDIIDLSQTLAASVTWTVSGATSIVTVTTAYGPMTINVQGTVTAASFVLTAGLVLGTAGNDNLVGTSEANTMFGGAGADHMEGGLGDDYYVVDNPGDVVVENPGAGHDTVESSVSFVLPADVEDLLLSGTGAIDGTGNALANAIFGNAAANLIDGGAGNDWLYGGGGADTLRGGTGDDLYLVDSSAATVVELAGEGVDRVESSVSYVLGAHVENLTLIGISAIDGTGNDLANILIGNAAPNRLDGGLGADTMEGGLGNDIYVVDQAGDVVTEGFEAGIDTVLSAISYTLGWHLEHLVLTGAAAIDGTGNDFDNRIEGNGAANRLDGGWGADTMIGGAGNDTYVVSSPDDVVIELAGGGVDWVEASVSYVLPAHVENLRLTEVQPVNGTGNALANRLVGSDGDNTLDGGAGADIMEGGGGNDIYFVDHAGDVVVEVESPWTDHVYSSVSYVLGAHVENLTLTGTAAINGTGNAQNNHIIGNAAANVLDAGSGGWDTLEGGGGDDIYVIAANGVSINEFAGGGTDTVRSSISYALGWADLENLVLTGAGAIDGTGNHLDNVVTGNAAANRLDGGAGADTLQGGGGDDVYIVDENDAVVEAAGQGVDRVEAYFSYTLGANIENLTLLGWNPDEGTGNTLANHIIGNGADNRLDGGLGADAMQGGWGNDIYVVDNSADRVIEQDGEGNDTVLSSVSFTLAAHVDNLTLTGSAAIDGTGSFLANVLTGNAAANRLDGKAGDDSMTGGAGDDVYVVDAAGDVVTELAGGGIDKVESAVTYTLGAHVENLVLTGTAAINGTGNGLANSLTGNSAANRLDGLAGADSMAGGGGDDIYYVDNALDTVTEDAGGGIDTVISSVSFALGANVENLILNTIFSAVEAIGNGLTNSLTGNFAANRLDGGAGADSMAGGLGNDSYVIDHSGDVVTEAADAGVDTVEASVTHVLSAHVENLVLTGTGAINGTGNALANTLTGNAGGNRLDGGAGADAMAGGAGHDTYVVDHAGDTVTEAAGAGTDTVEAAVNYTLGANIENLVLTGSALNATGNGLANTLTGNGLANRLDGKAGADAMAGGAGNDVYVVDYGGDTVVEAAGAGTDTVEASVTHMLGANVENLVLTGAAALNGTGNALANSLTGNAGANRLDGGAGADVMAGGAGNDVYVVDDALDQAVEASGAGKDQVRSSVSFTLGAHVEQLVLAGALAIDGTGNGLNNFLTGNAAANTLDGKAGADGMAGGAGDDFYVVDHIGDRVTENAGEGIDTVTSSVSFSLTGHVENLVLTGAAALTATGNSLANAIAGNAGANTINGGGGADAMAGGGGNDIYIVDNVGDVVTELAGQGTDLVKSTVTFTLGAEVEKLTLRGSGAIDGTGNAVANTIAGNEAANRLDGGAGADKLLGAGGNDVYIVDNVADQVIEASSGGGLDRVESSVSFTLGDHVEELVLTGAGAIDGTGNAGANSLTGNAAANRLDGGRGNDVLAGGGGDDSLLGGLGLDTLTGGAGNDRFVFDKAILAANADNILDFTRGADTIVLENAQFKGLAAGAMGASALAIGTSAADADDRIVYDPATGRLWYDADGSGATAQILFATLASPPATLAASDFVVI